jgi:Ca-activated chloride channel homolog
MPLFAVFPRSFLPIKAVESTFHCVLIIITGFCNFAVAQRQLPYLDGSRNSPLAQVDFDEMYRQQLILDAADKNRFTGPPAQFETGTVSALDMNAPEKAVKQLKRAVTCLKEERIKEAVHDLQDAIKTYPKFVSAHIVLGLAYFDMKDKRAKDEFETATHLDDQLPASFLYLGMISLWNNDFSAADTMLEKAAFLSPNDPQILNVLAFAQNGAHKYTEVLQTVQRLHRLNHHGMADVHYVAAAAALSLQDVATAKTQLNTFLAEEPSGPLSAVARQRLDEFEHGNISIAGNNPAVHLAPSQTKVMTFPNSVHLESELTAVAAAAEPSDDSSDPADPPSSAGTRHFGTSNNPAAGNLSNTFTIRQAVDETALFLAVSGDGKMVDNLSVSDITIRDDNKPPERILQFLPQSKLPLRLGVLVDTSGSVEHRIGFEKRAAKSFLERVLNPESDLAFVAGFDTEVSVTQDFTGDTTALDQGVDKLGRDGEGTAVFDAVHFACWKLAAYPDEGRVARVLVVLSDGEDNMSHRSLKQSIEAAEAAGITVYTINTSENTDLQTDANHVLQTIGQRSGGESMYARSLRELEHYFRQLSDAIRSRYLIAYKPANFVPDGSYHRLKVTAERDGKRLQVHVRKGYYARLAWNHQ